jgi:cadaverine:lysine antiporter
MDKGRECMASNKSDAVRKLGLIPCAAIVAGNIMSSGIALLPANLAAIGSITFFSWIFSAIGAVALAYIYAQLAVTDPQAGGPIAYAAEVSPILGYQAGMLYFHASWVGNLALAVAGVAYLSIFFPALTHPIHAGVATIIVIWLFSYINIFKPNWIGHLMTLGVILLMLPVTLTGTIGWFFFSKTQFLSNWNVSGQNNFSALTMGMLLCLWSFIGLESASTNTALAKNPKVIIPRSTMIGILLAASLYILSSTAILGMFSAKTLINSGAPFAMATYKITGEFWASKLASIFTTFACLTALGSWMMLVSQAGARSAQEGILIKAFGQLSKRGIPAKGLVMASIMMTILTIVLMTLDHSAQEIFGHVISIAVLLIVLPYFYSALNFFRAASTYPMRKRIRYSIVSIIAALYCFTAFFAVQHGILVGALIVSLIIFVFYARKDRINGHQ